MFNRIIGCIFLIAGTSIGAGMIGMPVKMIGINFNTIILIFLLCWFIMFTSAIAMLEISIWSKNNSSIVNISNNLIGKKYNNLILILYLLFLYSLMIAYISGGSTMIINIFNIKCKISLKIIFIIPFAFLMYLGINSIDKINKILFIILTLSYIIITTKLTKNTYNDFINFNFLNKKIIIFSTPIIITSFGYSLLIPSIKIYLLSNIKKIITAITIGSIIPLVIYLTWEYFISYAFILLGNKLFIKILFGKGNPTEKIIFLVSNNKSILFYIAFFSFFAIISSLLGVVLSIYDFFFDLIKIKKTKKNKIIILILVFIIPLIINILFPYIFMAALSYAGIFASILLIIFPTYLVWYGNYIKEIKPYMIKNKFLLIFNIYIGFVIIFIDIIEKFYF